MEIDLLTRHEPFSRDSSRHIILINIGAIQLHRGVLNAYKNSRRCEIDELPSLLNILYSGFLEVSVRSVVEPLAHSESACPFMAYSSCVSDVGRTNEVVRPLAE